MLSLQHCALHKFHMTDGQSMPDQITRDRRSNCVLCIPFILSGGLNKSLLRTCGACVISIWRLGLQVLLVTRNKHTPNANMADLSAGLGLSA